jgi:hypothetical protein
VNAAAAQAHHNACAKTRLGMSLHHLEICRDRAQEAGMGRQARTIERWIREQTEVFQTWPAAARDRMERAS